MITDHLPYSHRLDHGGNWTTPIADIVADQPAQEQTAKDPRKKDLRPMLLLAFIVVYSVTVVTGGVVIVQVNNYGIAKACIQAGGQWVQGKDAMECRRDQSARSSRGGGDG